MTAMLLPQLQVTGEGELMGAGDVLLRWQRAVFIDEEER